MKYLLLFFLLVSCATSPSGRNQLLLLPKSQMASLGQESYAQMKKQKPLLRDKKTNSYVQCITKQLLVTMKENPNLWEINVFNDKSPNAFALPGRKMGIHSGMLKMAETQEQLAAVIGHEIAHVLANHGNERLSQGLLLQGGLIAADISLSKNNSSNKKEILAALGLGSQFGVLLPFSRKHESEADALGLAYMARAGFNPQEAVELWQNMAKSSSKAPELLSTHPSPKTRIKNLQKLATNYQSTYNNVKIKPDCSKHLN